MKKLCFITAFLLSSFGVQAQTDTSKRDGYIPLFENLTTPGVPLPENFNGKIRVTNSADSTEISVADAVENLRSLYNAGRFGEAFLYSFYVRMRKSRDKFTKEETETFHKYAIASMKEIGYDEKADSLIRIFCRQSPFYKTKKNDPSAFVKLKKNFETKPVFGVRVTISKVYPIVVLDTVYTVRAKDGKYKYSNFNASSSDIQAVYYPAKNISISGGLAFSKFSYERLEEGENVRFSYAEKDKFFCVPFEVSYSLPKIFGTVVPEVFAGVKYTDFYKSRYSTSDLKRSEIIEVKKFETLYCSGDFDNQKSHFMTVYGGIRLNYEYHRFCAFAGLSYGFAAKELRKPEDKYKNPDLAVNHLFVPDAMRLNQIALSFGVKVNMFYRTLAKYGYGY